MEVAGVTALIGAYEPGPGPGGLRALQPLAGMSLVEHQAHRAAEAGAARVLLLVDEMPAELADAIVRLRHAGIPAGTARGIDAAADALGADEPVLLVAEACLPGIALLRAVLASQLPTVAALPDLPEYGQFERIDGTQRWAGVALLDGHRIAETAAMIGAWDPVSTLLRRAVQEDAARVEAADPPLLATDAAALAGAEKAILVGARRPADDLIGRVLFSPTEELAMPLLLARRIDADMVAAAGAALASVGGVLAVFGWTATGLIALLLSGPVAAGAARLSRIRQGSRFRETVFARIRGGGAALGAVGIARLLVAQSGQWGWWLVGTLLIGAMLDLAIERREEDEGRPLWLASVDTLIWAMLPFALLKRWDMGLGFVTLYASLSFGWVHWRRLRKR